ncbi:MAG: type II toxin-antitoxin system HicA family toxin [Chloroflexota bacterium]|nr:MAG: type II toxin-antitoxin system HicA family toxin [Chloroflexota bacterium]
MARWRLVLARVLSGSADRGVRFADLRGLLLALGFEERVRSSHHIYTRSSVVEILNLQPCDGGMAKPYQVRQVRDLIVKYRLTREIQE